MSTFAIDRSSVLSALANHIGKDRGIKATDLVSEITWGKATQGEARQLRHVIEDLRREGQHICGKPTTGYFIAANEEELNDTCVYLTNRAMTSLKQVSSMKKVSLPDIYGQLRLKI